MRSQPQQVIEWLNSGKINLNQCPLYQDETYGLLLTKRDISFSRSLFSLDENNIIAEHLAILLYNRLKQKKTVTDRQMTIRSLAIMQLKGIKLPLIMESQSN